MNLKMKITKNSETIKTSKIEKENEKSVSSFNLLTDINHDKDNNIINIKPNNIIDIRENEETNSKDNMNTKNENNDNDSNENDSDDEDKWIPKYKDCPCCYGFVYKCKGEACFSLGECYCKMKDDIDEDWNEKNDINEKKEEIEIRN